MKAIVVTPGIAYSTRIIDIKRPEIRSNEVLVKTIRVGIDGTDSEICLGYYGAAPSGDNFLILGHEALGQVLEVGNNISKKSQSLKIDDLVVPLVRKPGDCYYCLNGAPDMCIGGKYKERGIKGLHGFMSEFFTEDPNYLIRIPKEIESVAVLLEPLSVVEKGIRQAWDIEKRIFWQPKIALVLGLGPVGFLASIVLNLLKLKVFVYSLEKESDPRVKIIKELGIEYISADTDIFKLSSIIKGNIDFIFEATGNSSVALKSMSLIGKNGVLCLTGVTGGNKKLTICADCLNLDLVLGNKIIFGTVNANKIDFEEGIKHMKIINQNNPSLLEKIISHRFTPNEFKQGLENFQGIKAVIEF